ncbi:endodeoxyribonuclease [Methylobacterium sp. SD21]|uniref:endodeoxyribonuclease n=1 Tax=Methylobacterium litchii TaxID=3138810 RepID=UPI00313B209E
MRGGRTGKPKVTLAAKRAKFGGCRNALEHRVRQQLGAEFEYETTRMPYTIAHHYQPDFIDPIAKRIIEVKGRFPESDRRKMAAVRKQYPDYQIEIRFSNPDTLISKTGTQTYRTWCTKHGITATKA